MNVLNVWNEGGRNGLDSEFFNFAPLAAFAVAPSAVLIGAKARNKRKTKYANAETQRLAEAYPEQDNASDQATILQQLLAESAVTLEKRNKSKGKKRAELTGKLRAYDEYIQDYQKRLAELRAVESQPKIEPIINQGSPSVPSSMKGITPTKTAPEDQVLGTTSVDNQGTTKQMEAPTTTELQGMVQGATPTTQDDGKKDNTMLFVGLGLAVVLILALRK